MHKIIDMAASRRKKRGRLPAPDETFGQRLARIRKDRGFTQTELADQVGTIQVIISGYERGRTRAHADMVAAIAQALDVCGDELLGLKPPDSNPAAKISRRFLRRLHQLEELPAHDQKAILKHIDALSAAHRSKKAS
ncbi:MAG: helix-turn-helix transcriptional regulator [bacterium]|nr:helix-turn-helix transcriptional regulator [bacterium]